MKSTANVWVNGEIDVWVNGEIVEFHDDGISIVYDVRDVQTGTVWSRCAPKFLQEKPVEIPLEPPHAIIRLGNTIQMSTRETEGDEFCPWVNMRCVELYYHVVGKYHLVGLQHGSFKCQVSISDDSPLQKMGSRGIWRAGKNTEFQFLGGQEKPEEKATPAVIIAPLPTIEIPIGDWIFREQALVELLKTPSSSDDQMERKYENWALYRVLSLVRNVNDYQFTVTPVALKEFGAPNRTLRTRGEIFLGFATPETQKKYLSAWAVDRGYPEPFWVRGRGGRQGGEGGGGGNYGEGCRGNGG